MDSFFNDSLSQALLRSFTWAKFSDVAIRAFSLYVSGYIFGSSLAFDYLTVVGVSTVRFDYLNVLRQPLDAIFFAIFDGFVEIFFHYAVVLSLHYGVHGTVSLVAELVEMWQQNSTFIITACTSVVLLFLLVDRPWSRLVRAYHAFRRIDDKFWAWRNFVVRFAIMRIWFLARVSIFLIASILYVAVLFLMVLNKVIDDAWLQLCAATADGRLRTTLPSLVIIYLDFEILVRMRKRRIMTDVPCWIMFQLWRLQCSTLGPVKDALRLGAGFPHTLEFSDRPDYMYRHLDGVQEIRLLRLDKSSNGILQGSLIHVRLQDAPSYDCISYTWGDASPTHEMFIDGYRFSTSNNVFSVLKAQSSPWRTRNIWIDSICINQSNDTEKSSQVAMMRKIYQNASQVVVWLGDFDEAPQATQSLAELKSVMAKKGTTTAQVYKQYVQRTGSANWTSLIKLLKLPWFHRVWVVQEIAMARKLRVLIGGRHFDWENFLSVIQIFADPAMALLLQEEADFFDIHTAIHGTKHVLQMAHFRSVTTQGRSLPLASYLETTSGFMSTDPRDRVFALLGLVDHSWIFQPKYTDNVGEVYFRTACAMVRSSDEAMFILYFAGIGYERKLNSLPSWVPDWSVTRTEYPTLGHVGKGQGGSYYSAGGTQIPSVYVDIPTQTLRLPGVVTDTIARLGTSPSAVKTVWNHQFNPWHHHHQSRLHLQKETFALASGSDPTPYPNGTSRPEAIWRTLIGDLDPTTSTRPAPPEYSTYFSDWQIMTQDITSFNIRSAWALGQHRDDQENVPYNPELPTYFRAGTEVERKRCHGFALWTAAMMRAWGGRRFGVTAKGYFGLFPPGAMEGDELCLFWGAQTPFVVRVEDREGGSGEHDYGGHEARRRALVGECYVHGIMDGEALQDHWGEIEGINLV